MTPQPAAPVGPPTGSADSAVSSLIPYKNSAALIAYYLAIFSMLAIVPVIGLIFTILGILAFFLGLKGLKDARARPEIKGTVHAWIGIVLGGLCGFGSVAAYVFLISLYTHH